jgi:hypothetical protein
MNIVQFFLYKQLQIFLQSENLRLCMADKFNKIEWCILIISSAQTYGEDSDSSDSIS